MLNICFESTKKCNLSCEYCITSDNPIISEENEKSLEVLSLISSLKPDRLVISGGEPLLDDKLIEKLELIKSKAKSTYISLSTNATVTFDFVKLKGLIDCIDISLPSLDEEIYTIMRGKNYVATVKHNIEKCVKNGFNVRISSTLTKINQESIMDILDFAQQVKVKSVRIGRYLPLRNANICKENYELNISDVNELMNKITKKEFDFTIVPPIQDLELMKSGYISIDYLGNMFFPNDDGKNIILNILSYRKNELINKLDELSINNIQSNIFLNHDFQKYDFQKYFSIERIRTSKERSIMDALYSDRSRIIFSSPFRRLQQKAQVFSLEPNSNVRSRLTHSLEVSDAGRRIAYAIIDKIDKNINVKMSSEISNYMIAVIENACLLHDIGNPPFGHFGENAIKCWWKEKKDSYIEKYNENAKKHKEKQISFVEPKYNNLLMDFQEFDGNPQGLRIALRLYNISTDKEDFTEMNKFESGFNLTYSTIMCSLKYIRVAGSKITKKASEDIAKKAGYFNSEARIIKHIRENLKINENSRYPFVYLMEAADDIAYCLSDISDGFEKNLFSKKEFVDRLNNALDKEDKEEYTFFDYDILCKLIEKNDFDFNYHISSPWANIMIDEVTDEFVNNITKYLTGKVGSIINKDSTPKSFKLLNILEEIRIEKLYRSSEAETIELAGYSIITGLLKYFGTLLELTYKQFNNFVKGEDIHKMGLDYEYRLFNRLSKKFVQSYQYQIKEWAHYNKDYNITEIEWWLRVHLIVDHITSMTDEYALRTFQTCEGIDIKIL